MRPDIDAPDRTRMAAWYVSALGYRWSSTAAAERADDDLFAYLGSQIKGASVVDCGCGPGLLSEKLSQSGARMVLAVDANPAMVRQASRRLHSRVAKHQVLVRQAFIDDRFFANLEWAPDLVIFKRSLYSSKAKSIRTLRAAITAIAPSGMIVIVHPERSLVKYAFGDPPRLRSFSAFHLVNRFISLVAVALGISAYCSYSAGELVEMVRAAGTTSRVDIVPTGQDAYNIVALLSL